jgi:sulfotransferase
MIPRLVTVAGLPRSGSTLLCQLLAEHPLIHCEGHSSPLINTLLTIRRSVSQDEFLLSQLDAQFDVTYQHLKDAKVGFLRGWYAHCDKPVVVDKNRAWLHSIEYAMELAPEVKMLVCIRELGQVYGSVEAAHQKTSMLDFGDRLADYDRFGRANQLFANDKVIGGPLASINAINDLTQSVKDRMYFVKFEDLMAKPVQVMKAVYKWIGVIPHEINPKKLSVRQGESDSYYRFKYRHVQFDSIQPVGKHEIPTRIQEHIENAFPWYYEMFYPKAKVVKPS